ncbi:MAG: T9SS type A sorting domain-containing protein [FCB group bacterium]|nr:T9SS type A sorting domain-containing protein [FCB group bacterium]MBL7122934.1 T9SS type A sorting domain-containing protein [Candidatus Neomarinimicrobiota bacterium]
MPHVIRNILSIVLLISTMSASAQSVLRESVIDSRYHTYEEIVAYMDSIQQIPAYNAILDVREIGRSNNEDLPIYAIKLSDNPTLDEDEPALLFLGQCHAEEILGVEITMGLVDSLLHGFDAMNSHVASILQNLEVWVVPSYNPEGLRVVHDGIDVTYRKNKTDNNGNGIFDYVEGIGYDIDGVDFNRNYDFNWIFGDAYEVDDYDYYRGPSAFSESETRAIADLARQEKFLLSVAYHSARSGTPEIIYYSWEWEETKFPPDINIMSSLATTLSERVINESRDGNYAVTPGKTQRGNAHDWFYTQTGAIQFLVEVGTNNLQPNADIIDDTVDRNLDGLFFLMDRAYGRSPESKAQITGIVRDASDGFALEGAQIQLARLNVNGSMTPLEGLMMQPRVTDGFGRYRRLVNQGTYRVIASAPGFEADTIAAILTSESYATILDFSLNPAPLHTIHLELLQEILQENYQVILWDDFQRDTLSLSVGAHSFNWQGNDINIQVSTPGYFPELHAFDLRPFGSDQELSFSVDLPTLPTTIYSTGFDDLSGWQVNAGEWVIEDSKLKSQPALFYEVGLESEMVMDLDLSAEGDAKRLAIHIDHAYEVEWHIDTLSVEIWNSDDSERLIQKQWFDQNFSTHSDLFFMDGDIPTSGRLKLKMKTDSTVAFRGWEIDSLTIFLTGAELVGIDPRISERQTQASSNQFEMTISASPNPFRSTTHIEFEIPQTNRVSIDVFDIRGRAVYSEKLSGSAGTNTWVWQGQNMQGHRVSTGIYFVRINDSQQIATRKLMLMNK